ncbi:MAG: esterase/lipase family protein, partial [Candidatus Binatia bacterium]
GMSVRRSLAAAVALAVTLASCAAGPYPLPDLGGLYDRAAQFDDAARNPVIVIPGILGSRLRDRESGRLVWGAFEGTYANPRAAEGARLVALPMAIGTPLAELRDEVEPGGVLDAVRIRLFGLPIEQAAYVFILRSLGVGGYRDESLGRSGTIRYADDHFTCFQFPYDWRRDNAENARRLHEFILEKRAYVAAELERRYGIRNRDVKFDVVAHSMGGLLLRYYLMYGDAALPEDGSMPEVTWAGARHVENAVVVATPSAGSAEAVRNLVDGAAFSWVLPRYPAALLGTMPALYELLPRTRHAAVVEGERAIDLFDAEEWRRRGWGLASPAADDLLADLLPGVGPAERRAIALDHLAKSLTRARQFHAALDRAHALPAGLGLHLYAGDAEKTVAALEVGPEGALAAGAFGSGDGTVLRSSALLDERVGGAWMPRLRTPIPWSSVTFVYGDHLSLTSDPAFTDNVLYRLLESPRGAPINGPT